MGNNNINQNSANRELIYSTFLYLASREDVRDSITEASFGEIVDEMEVISKEKNWEGESLEQLEILIAAINNDNNDSLANTKVGNYSWLISDYDFNNTNGLNACTFIDSDNNISVVFRGTGKGEWLDNAEGIDGIPEENIYYNYDLNGKIIKEEKTPSQLLFQQNEGVLISNINFFNAIK